MGFALAWTISAGILVSLALWAGSRTPYGTFAGILIDNRERYSLNRLQLVIWTLLILSNFLALLMAAGFNVAFTIPNQLLILLGISTGSATVSGAVKNGKDIARPQAIVGGPNFAAKVGAPQQVPPHFAQIFLEEEGAQADQIVSVTKFQNFIFTVALGVVYIVLAAAAGTAKEPGYPNFAENVLWLIGISHAGYVGGKLPNKS